MMGAASLLQNGDGLLIVDVQIDFCPGGRLPIEEGDKIVPILNIWIEAAVRKGIPVYASRDFHPLGHVSFREYGGKWPMHCVQNSEGARFHPDLKLPEDVVLITKGVRFDQDQNSAFDQTGFASQLRRDGVTRLWIGGLALDVCVRYSALDARREGFDVICLQDATKPVTPEGGREAIQEMENAGVRIHSVPHVTVH